MKTIFKLLASGALGGNPLESIKSSFQFWSDGTANGTQLTDKSGNNRHATLTSNIMTLGNVALNQTSWFQFSDAGGGTAPSVNEMVVDDVPPGDDASMRFRWVSVAAFFGHQCQYFIMTNAGEYAVTFWAKRVTSTAITVTINKGDGTTVELNLALASPGVKLISGSSSVGSWGQYRHTFTNNIPGGRARIYVNGGAGTHEVKFGRNFTVTCTGQTNNCFTLPVDATLQSTDSNNIFYTSAGVPKTIRADYTWGAWKSDRIFCGGAFKYVFMNADITASQYSIISNNFENLAFQFDSIPWVRTIKNSGGDFTTIEAAQVAAASTGTFLHRQRFDVYDNQSVTTRAAYLENGSIDTFVRLNKAFVYLKAVGVVELYATKEVTITDAEMGNTETIALFSSNGIYGFTVKKRNGGYVVHDHFTSAINHEHVYLNCTFTDLGSQEVIDYRIANALSYSSLVNGKAAFAGGFVNGVRTKMRGCTFSGIYAFSYHNQDATGASGKCYLSNCVLNSDSTIYDPIFNNNASLHDSLLLTSHTSAFNSYVIANRLTKNSTTTQDGTGGTVILSEV